MRLTINSALLVGFFLLFCLGCSDSSGGKDPVSPDLPLLSRETKKTETAGYTSCLALWQVAIDKDSGEIEVVSLRSSALIINVLGFLEPPALAGLSIDFNTLVIADPVIEVDVVLTHPFQTYTNEFTGFDVRGVVFGPELTNADGLTMIPPPEFFANVPFGYKDGLLGVSDSIGDYTGLAGYKYFTDGLNHDVDLAEFMSNEFFLDNRGNFPEGGICARHYSIDWSNVSHDFFVFNYAIYANCNWPVGPGPYGLNDFDLTTANSAEAFCCSVTETSNSLYNYNNEGGGNISLEIEVWDWQGDISYVTVESMESGIISSVEVSDFINGNTSRSYIFNLDGIAGTPAATGELDILITAVDERTFGECWFLELLDPGHPLLNEGVYNCWIYTTTVGDCPPPSISSIDPDWGKDSNGALEVTITGGYFVNGPSEDVRFTMTGESPIVGAISSFTDSSITATFDLINAANGDWDVEVTNGCGFQVIEPEGFSIFSGWALTWGGGADDRGYGVATDDAGNIYISGDFRFTVDFDPGLGQDIQIGPNNYNNFVSKFDSSGNLQWANTWGGGNINQGSKVALHGSSVYVAGTFSGTVDFDPGPGTENRTSTGGGSSVDSYLCKFDSSGDFQWVGTWGTYSTDFLWGIDVDSSGDIYVCGQFYDIIDFDPGPGTVNRTTAGQGDAYLSKFNPDGTLDWVQTWGASLMEWCEGTAVDPTGSVYVIGVFFGTVDFDPGPGVSYGYSVGNFDVFLSKLDSDGVFQWVRTWGGDFQDQPFDLAVDNSGNCFVTGSFYDFSPVDFDHGVTTDWHSTNGIYDVFLSKTASDGSFLWAKTWGGSWDDQGKGVAVDDAGNPYVTGCFSNGVDFDPDGGIQMGYSNGDQDVFISKFNSTGTFQMVRIFGSPGYGPSGRDWGHAIAIDGSGNIFTTGYFSSTANFAPGGAPCYEPADNHISYGSTDVFLIRHLPDGCW